MNRCKILFLGSSLAALLCALPPLLIADIGVDNTQGPGSYQDSSLNLDANITKQVNFGLGYEQASSSSSVTPNLTKTYTGNISIKSGDHLTFGFNLLGSPEANDTKSSGWGASISYNSAKPAPPEEKPGEAAVKAPDAAQAGDHDDQGDTQDAAQAADKDEDVEAFTWGCSLAYNAATLSEFIDYNTYQKRLAKNGKAKLVAIDHSDWYDLKQTHADPALTCELFELLDFNLGCSKYTYDKDVSLFSQKLAKLSGTKGVKNGSFGTNTALIDGFPDSVYSAGVSVSPWDSLKLELDWARTSYVLDQPQEDSTTFTVFYTISSTIQLKAGYNVLSTQAVYVLTGVKWIW